VIIDFLHINVIHWSSGKHIGLLGGRVAIAIAIPIALLDIGTLRGILSCLLALEVGDMAQILLGWCRAVLIPISSIAILMAAVVGTIVAVSSMVIPSMSMSSMGVMGVPSMVMSVTGLLLSSKTILSLCILPFAALDLLLLSLQDEGLLYQLLVVAVSSNHQLLAQIIVETLQKLLLLGCIISHIFGSIPG
jgi:hypothetical protein